MACAKRKGWDLFESGLHGFTVQRDDAAAMFRTDADAAIHVRRCLDCRAALVMKVRKAAADIADEIVTRAILEEA